ncbi:MAG: LemA family protein [Bacilli bacterium]|nr:LemA family protein [Bacilli bacterium]MDD4831243.1 LemA family protein [Bacilli bacterium]
MEWLYILIGVVVVVGLFVTGTYNALVSARNRAKDQWAQVDVQLKKRFDLIPNLVETVKGYAKHEKDTFEQVVEARNKFNSANTPEQEMQAAGELNGVLSRLFALAEAYPELKADQNFLQLQVDLKDTEEKIAYARQFYNDSVLNYKNKLEMFPSNIIANMFKFTEMKFFEANESEKETPKVSFDEK